jgi:Tim10/DDP family zinc finger
MADIGAQLNSLSPEQRQAVMMQAQQEANQSIMQELMKEMVTTCFEKCSGTSVRFYDSRMLNDYNMFVAVTVSSTILYLIFPFVSFQRSTFSHQYVFIRRMDK